MHTSTRTRPIRIIGVHTNEGPETPRTSGEGLRDYLYNNGDRGGGYQAATDDDDVTNVQPDNVVCWANGAVNNESIDICIIGYAAQVPQEWDDAFDRGALRNAAMWVATKCLLYQIPPVRLTPQQLRNPASKGICGHGDLTAAGYLGTNGHTDPGAGFPWARFLQMVRKFMGIEPLDTPTEEVEMLIQHAPGWQWKSRYRPAAIMLDIHGKAIRSLNGGWVEQMKKKDQPLELVLAIPEHGEVRGWFSLPSGFMVMGSKNAAGENPAYEYTWPKQP